MEQTAMPEENSKALIERLNQMPYEILESKSVQY